MGQSSTNEDGSQTQDLSLAAGFAKPTEAQWLELVSKVLKGGDVSKLESVTPGGLKVLPLYTDSNTDQPSIGVPGEAPFTRGATAVAGESAGWALRVEVPGSDPAVLNDRALEALERGASELSVIVENAPSADSLNAGLADVLVDIAPVFLRPAADFTESAAALIEVWQRRGVSSAEAVGGFGADPIGVLAATGVLPQGVDQALAQLGSLAASTASTHPNVRSINVSTVAFANAGADEVQELAIALATGAAYLRACAASGLDADSACRQIEFTLTTDADVFTGVAKLRAFRELWNHVALSCGAAEGSRAPRINVRTAESMMTRRDPWVNLLRVTAASLAAALGGADSLTTLAYDTRLGEQGELGRRMARNTHLLLAEESNLSKVTDPMGGSWYIETLTAELVDSAWKAFQSIETSGGMPGALVDGHIAELISSQVAARFAKIAKRRQPITGVSEFPNLAESDTGATGHPTATQDAGFSTDGTRIEPLAPIHWSQDFERLRDRSDLQLAATGKRPTVFLVNLGPVSKHTARATYAKNFYATGGIDSVTSTVGETTGFDDPQAAVADATAAGADLVCICSSDDIYAERSESVVKALAAAGVGAIHLAGRPGDMEGPLRSAGVGEFVFVGVDALEILERVHDSLGTPQLEG